MIRVLFVCLGNICRSPIAEGVFNELVRKEELEDSISCDSAGTAAYHIGKLADSRMRDVSLKNGFELTHRARQFIKQDFEEFDYILAMDESNFSNIERVEKDNSGFLFPVERLYLYREFDKESNGIRDVPDPYYENLEAFDEVYRIVHRCGKGFLDFIIEKHNLK